MQLEKAALACGARVLHFSPAVLTGAASDSRNVRRGDLFAAIRGERVDGHDFARTAVSNGASAVLAQRDPFQGEPLSPVLLVEDSVKALGCIAHAWRKEFKGKVIGITGTAGKTTTKELLAHILSLHGKTARTPMNLNSQIGMPISIMAADGDEDFWIMEAGISHPEDMDELGPILEPDMAIILNAGTGHSLGLGDRGTAYYKARLLAHRKKGGTALICADYDDLAREARMLCPEAVFFSTQGRKVPYRVAYRGLDEKARGQYRLWLEGKEVDVTCALSGAYAAENILAAAAAAHLSGLSRQEIKRGVETALFPSQRFARHEIPGWTVIDDTYNANPLSAARMIEASAELARGKAFVCVMGAMGELGDLSAEEHRKLGRILAGTCEALFWFGSHREDIQKGLEEASFSGAFFPLSSLEEFLPAITCWEKRYRDNDSRNGLILFKGSRVNRMERLVNLFMEQKNHAL